MAAGASVLGGAGGLGGLAAAVVGGAAGSIASQAVGNAIGAVDGFSWKSVALGGLSAGMGAGLGQIAALAGTTSGMVIARAAIGNAMTQGIAVVTGLQDHFDWKGVAASAVGAGVGYGMNEALGLTRNGLPTNNYTGFDKYALAGLSGFAAGTAAAAARGGRVSVQQVATDSFGNALGQGMADAMKPDDPLGDFIAKNDARRASQDAAAAAYNSGVVERASASGESIPPTVDTTRRLGLFNFGADGQLDAGNRQALSFLQGLGVTQNDALQAAPRMASSGYLDMAGSDPNEAFNWGRSRSGAYYGLNRNTLLPISNDPEITAAYESVIAQSNNAGDAADVAKMVGIRKFAVDPMSEALAAGRISDPTGQIAAINRAMVYGLLAKDVYYNSSIQGLMPNGFSRVADANLPAGITPELLNNPKTGYFGALYQNANNGTVVFANRGTQDVEDIRNNVLQANGLAAPQYTAAMSIATTLAEQYGSKLSFVGHSLGGGLAAAQAIVTGLPAVTFNAAGLSLSTVSRYNGLNLSNAANLITAYNVQGEPLNYFQDMRTMPQGWNTGGQRLAHVFAVGNPMPTGLSGWGASSGVALSDLAANSSLTSYAGAVLNPVNAFFNPPNLNQQYEANFMPQAAGSRVTLMPATDASMPLANGMVVPGGNLSGSFSPQQHFMSNMFYSLYTKSTQIGH